KLFEVARSCIVYGYLCYPLVTLGVEQLHRVLEAAVRMKAKALNFPSSGSLSYSRAILWLVDKNIIDKNDLQDWDSMRWLRNYSSHPNMQTIHHPGTALETLANVAERINSLYPRP